MRSFNNTAMTSAHAFYIPTIFLLGYLTAVMVQSRHIHTSQNITTANKHNGFRLLIAFFLFGLVFTITHFFTVPGSVSQVHHALNGMPLFDQSPVYSATEVYARINQYSDRGLAVYQRFTYTTDLIFPLTLFLFLRLSIKYLRGRKIGNSFAWRFSMALPFIWLSMDLIENAMVFWLLMSHPVTIAGVAGSLGYVTTTKFALLLASFLLPALLFTLPTKATTISDKS